MVHSQFKLLFSFILISITILIGQIAYAQLPDPHDFCSHTKSSGKINRQAHFNYANHDAYDIHFYYLNLRAETNHTLISGFAELQASIISNTLDTVYLELTNSLIVDSVILNHHKVSFNHIAEDILFFSPPQKILQGESLIARIYYHGQANNSESGRGYNSEDSYHGTRVNWTLSEPFYSKDWWPCKQDLQDKADSVWVFISTSKENKVGSNGLLSATVPLPNDQVRYEWKSYYPIAYYLISFSMAKYMEYSFYTPPINNKSVWIQNYIYPDSAMYKSEKTLIDCTKIEMNLLREKYGEYPFIDEKYGHCISRIGGGMEHQTMTTQVNFSFHLSIHEMGHSWFGDQVTCATWNDIWLNEGFATYTQFLGLEYLADREMANGFMAAMQSVVMREAAGSVYVPEDEIENRDRIFSGRLSYYKGATIIHMIRYLLHDDELFFHVLQEFQSRYAYQTATAEDFKDVLEELSNKSFTDFFDLWYYGEGYPIYHFEWEQAVNNHFILSAEQESSTSLSPFFDMVYDVQLFFTNGSDTIISIHQEQAKQKVEFQLKKRVKAVIPNPKSWNLMDVQGVYTGLTLPGIIKIEPNPTHNFALIRFANIAPQRRISIYNSSLQLIEESDASGKYIEVDVESYSRGIYFIQISDGVNVVLEKLVKY